MIRELLKRVYLKIRKLILIPFLSFRKVVIPERDSIRNILFLRHDRIGDMVLSTPTLEALKQGLPGARLIVLSSLLNRDILLGNPFVDEVIVYERKLLDAIRIIGNIRQRQFDLIIDPFLTYELWTAFLSFIMGAKYRIGFEISGREIFFNIKGPKGEGERTVLDHTLDLARSLDIKIKDHLPFIYLSESERSKAGEMLREKGIEKRDILIGIHPGGYYESQRWPAERFGLVGDRIILEYGAKVIIFVGEEDREQLDVIRKAMGGNPVIIQGAGLRDFIALLSYCNLLLCNNSGPLHIATALRVPTVSTMGPTVPYLWWPAGDNNIVLRKGIKCSPCNKDVCKGKECMELITPDDMMDAVTKKIAGSGLRYEKRENR
ncbi:MAG: glycosyltransferase family 9 protein [Nitrospirota bacterium]